MGNFEGSKLHGLGKRVNPNEFIEVGDFGNDVLLKGIEEMNEAMINWNDFVSISEHITILKDAAGED